MAHDVFISYAQEDKTIADAVCATLEKDGIRCWIAPRDVLSGVDWPVQIIEAIEATKILVLVFSDHANHSWPVKNEVERAMHKEVPIIPLRIQNVAPGKSLEFFISTPHWLDALTPPIEAHLQKVVQTVRALLDRLESDPTKKRKRDEKIIPPDPIRRLPKMALIAGACAMIAIGLGLWVVFGGGRKAENESIVSSPQPAGQSNVSAAIAPMPAPVATPVAPTTPVAVAPQTLRARVDSLMQSGKFKEAIAEADNARRTDPRNREAIFLSGMVKAQWMDHHGAFPDLEEAWKLDPANPETLMWLGVCYIAVDNLSAALSDADRVLKGNPKDAMALAVRSMVYAAKWDRARAKTDAEAATKERKDNYVTWLAMGTVYHAAGDVDDATRAFSEANRLAPYAPGPLAGRAASRAIAGELAGAEEDAKLAIQQAAPNASIPQLSLFQVYMAKEDFARAWSAADKAVKIDGKGWPPYVARASAAIMLNQTTDALNDAKKAVEINSNRADTLAVRAWAHAKAGNMGEAVADGNEAIRIDPTSPAGYNGRGLARLAPNIAAQAVPDFEKLYELLPNSPYARIMRATAYVGAYTQISPQKRTNAEIDCKYLVDKGAYSKQAHRLLWAIYLATNRPLDAAREFQLMQ